MAQKTLGCSLQSGYEGTSTQEGAELEGKDFDLQVALRSGPHLWSRVFGSDPKTEVANTNG